MPTSSDTRHILGEMHTFPVHALIGSKDNAVHRSPAWNEPGAPRYAEGDAVVIDTPGFKHHGHNGVVNSVIPAPATDAMRTREHHYYVRVEGAADRVLYSERDLRPHGNSDGRMEALLNGTPARAVIENDATPPRTPRRFPDLPPEKRGKRVFPKDAKYQELLRSFGYTDPTYYPSSFRLERDGSWEPVL